MRDRRGTLGACLAEVQGKNLDKLLCSLRTQESPRPSGAPSWAKKPAVDLHGNPHSETLSLAVRSDRSEASLLLHSGTTVLPYLKEPVRRNCASPVAQGKTVDLFFAPAEEHVAGGSCGVKGALVRDWLGGRSMATDGPRGRCCPGEPWGSGLQCHQKRSAMGVSEDEPSAFPETRGSEPEPSCLHSVLLPPSCAHPQVLLSGETECLSPGGSTPVLSEQTEGHRKVLPSVKSTSNDLQITLGLQAVPAFQVAKPVHHS
uniref:Putative stat3-interacting protein as a repressor n=1 Tax=Desmodus rotundus TaxID=9430 RepID=K9IZB5_DESRO